MKTKAITGIIITLFLLSMLGTAFNVAPVSAEIRPMPVIDWADASPVIVARKIVIRFPIKPPWYIEQYWLVGFVVTVSWHIISFSGDEIIIRKAIIRVIVNGLRGSMEVPGPGTYQVSTEQMIDGYVVAPRFSPIETRYHGFAAVEYAGFIAVYGFSGCVTTPTPTYYTRSTSLEEMIERLPDEAFKNNPDERKAVLSIKLAEVMEKIENEEYQDAINKLNNDIRAKMDGDSTAEDWIIDPKVQVELCAIIDAFTELLGTM